MIILSSVRLKESSWNSYVCERGWQYAGTLFPPLWVQDSQPRSASRPDPIPMLGPRAWADFSHFSFKFLSQFVESRSFAWLLLPANPHQGVNTRGAVLWSLHAIALLHFLFHLLQRLGAAVGEEEGRVKWGWRGMSGKCGDISLQIETNFTWRH